MQEDSLGNPIPPNMSNQEEHAARVWWATRNYGSCDQWGTWGLWSSQIQAFLDGYRAGLAASKVI